jgi:hypothetical protein
METRSKVLPPRRNITRRSITNISRTSPVKRKTKKTRIPMKITEVIKPYNISYNGIHLEELAENKHDTISKEFIDNIFNTTENDGTGNNSLYFCLSQFLYGNSEKHQFIEEEICSFILKIKGNSKAVITLKQMLKNKKDKCYLEDVKIYLGSACIKYKMNCILFHKSDDDKNYSVYVINDYPKHDICYLIQDPDTKKCELLVVKQGYRTPPLHASSTKDTEEVMYDVKSIKAYKYINRPYKSLEDVKFQVHWEGYSAKETTWEPVSNLYKNKQFHAYLDELNVPKKKHPSFLKDALETVDKFRNNGVLLNAPEPVALRTRTTQRTQFDVPAAEAKRRVTKRKPVNGSTENTGKKVTVIGDELQLKGKGGIYAYYPFETLDAKNKGIFKIGMSTNFESRFEQVHSYHPNGIYVVAFYSNPIIPQWPKSKLKKWADDHRTEDNPNPKPRKIDMESDYYKRMENYVFKFLEAHKAKRIHATTRVRHPNEDKMGATEYFYTNEELVHEAFQEAEKVYRGGQLEKFYLHGYVQGTGEVADINALAKERENQVPNFTGKIIYRL